MKLHAELIIHGFRDSTPLLRLETVCSACRTVLAATTFDASNTADLDALADRAATLDAIEFVLHALEVHGLARGEYGPPVVLLL